METIEGTQPIPAIVYTLADAEDDVTDHYDDVVTDQYDDDNDDDDVMTTAEVVHKFPTQETTTVDKDTGVVMVTKTDATLVRITKSPVTKETETVTLRTKRILSEEEKKEFAKEMERQRKEIIADQRRSTPLDILEAYAEGNSESSGIRFEAPIMTGQTNTESVVYHHSETNGEVDSQSILDNKESVKKFLMNRMQVELETQGEEDARVIVDSSTNARLASVKPPNLRISVLNAETVPSTVNGSWSSRVEEDSMHLVAARPCYIEQGGQSSSEAPREKKASAVVTESKIAREIEECRLREEELKLLRTESRVTAPKQPPTAEEQSAVMSGDGGSGRRMEKNPILPDLGGVEREETAGNQVAHTAALQANGVQPTEPLENGVKLDDRSSRRFIRVRPLVEDDKDEEDTLTYVLSRESVVEREIRLTLEREEELRKEKELALKLLQGSPEVKVDPPPLVQPIERSPEVVVAESVESVRESPPDSVTVLTLPNVPTLQANLTSKTLDTSAVNVHRENQRNLASARLQQEVNEVIQKELALKEAGSIVTTSRDRTDEKVINLRQYNGTEAVNGSPPVAPAVPTVWKPEPQVVPQSAPPIVTNGSVPSDTPNAYFSGRQFVFGQNGRVPAYRQTSLANGTMRVPTLQRSHTQKGVMARFIASRGKMTAMPVFVPKVPKEPLTPVILSPSTPPSPTPSSDSWNHKAVPQVDSPQLTELPTMPTFLAKSTSNEKLAYPRKSFSSAENMILREMTEMKEREEELRQQRIASFGKSYSLENLLESDDNATENNGELNGNGVHTSNGLISNGHHPVIENQVRR